MYYLEDKYAISLNKVHQNKRQMNNPESKYFLNDFMKNGKSKLIQLYSMTESTINTQGELITDPRQLVNQYKRSGLFDDERKKILNNFKSSNTYELLQNKVEELVNLKIQEDNSILVKNKGRTSALIQSSLINTGNTNGSSSSLLGKNMIGSNKTTTTVTNTKDMSTADRKQREKELVQGINYLMNKYTEENVTRSESLNTSLLEQLTNLKDKMEQEELEKVPK
ncbi:hypothetical protein B5S30_g1154 [[Candida] boidinii]|nr:hypothetical protein B5S27_g2940 [[Candida] boidinii]OWB65822.1 hypothetical protein B5S30_g1154 [[Candida] boidinii]